MSSYVGHVGSVGNNHNTQSNMYIGPYLVQDMNADILKPRIKPYSGWASYKNVKSGQYNRQLCWPCGDFKGFPQTAGTYDLNIVDTPLPRPNYNAMKVADDHYKRYQHRRMQNHPGSYGTDYVNYLTTQCGNLYPKRYVKGNWPDEQLIYTNTPANGCNTVAAGTPVCQ